jgi:hypothetical protein
MNLFDCFSPLILFTNFMIFALVALTAKVVAAHKALSEEKAARSAAEVARQITE